MHSTHLSIFFNMEKEAFSLVGPAVGTWPWKKNRNKLCLQVNVTIGIYYINFIQGKKIIVLSYIMNELGGDGEKDLHQCEDSKIDRSRQFYFIFCLPSFPWRMFYCGPNFFFQFRRRWTRKALIKESARGIVRVQGTHRSDGQYHKQYHSPCIVFPFSFSTDTNEGVVIKWPALGSIDPRKGWIEVC